MCFKRGVDAFQSKRYREAINMLSTAVNGGLKTEQLTKACYYLSDSYYEEKDYQRSVEYGRKAFDKDHIQNKEIAEEWKNRGNKLLLLSTKYYDIMSDCYSLALQYAPNECIEMRAAIYSNRSMAYVNLKKMNEAKEDAKECIKLRKTWFRGYSRLGACLTAEKKYQEAILEYCRGVQAVRNDSEKNSLITDILSTCMKLHEEIIQLPLEIPTKVMNEFVRQVVKDGEVVKLRSIFLEKKYNIPGSLELQCLGSFADCVSEIPLDVIIKSTIPEKHQLIEKLLALGAVPNRFLVREAISEGDFKLAAMFLRHGADPFYLLEKGESFDPRAPHLGQWLTLGRKAMKNKSPRAEVFYCLALEYPEAAHDKKAQHEAYKALSDICFEQMRYDGCIERGRQCFKVYPVKSETEALKWQRRAKNLTGRGSYDIVSDYLTLAMNYAPPSNEKLRYELLCMRSVSFREHGKYQEAIDDAKSAINIRPKDIEGHECLVACYRDRDLQNKTFSALVNCLNKVEQIDLHKKKLYLKEALNIAVNIPEGTSNLNMEVPQASLQELHDEAVESANWDLLRLLYLGGGGPHKYEIRKGGLCTGFNRAEKVPIEDVVSASFSFKPETIAALLENGANVDGLRGNANPLITSASKKEVEVMQVLLNHGANPCVKQDGSMPLVFKEVKKAIETGGLKVVHALLSSSHPDLENVQDSNGNSLFHLVMTGKKTNAKCKVLRALIDAKINPEVPNKQSKRPFELCSKRDDRNKMLKKFLQEFTPTPVRQTKPNNSQQPNNTGEEPPSAEDTWEDLSDKAIKTEVPDKDVRPVEETKKPIPVPKVNIDKQKKDDEKKYILYLIERLDVAQLSAVVQEQHVEDDPEDNSEDLTQAPNEEQEINLEDEGDEDREEDKSYLALNNEEASETDLVLSFENLAWEVDCTENVWKTLRGKKISERTRTQIIQKICMLAEGRWSTKQVCKRLEGEPKEKHILLYETRITRGARIIWEKTIAFSARCSNDPKLRLSMGNKGLIYSDIIRVWDIVLNHKDLEHRIHNIVESHRRGSDCIVKAELKGIKQGENESGSQLALPSYYQERHERDRKSDEQSPVFFPPASSEDNEYHILKFYSVTTALINTLLDNDKKCKIDFPFKVTELEHAIINLKQDKPCSIILLGRSGTGKTTCCLYRLWTEFQTYWENAITAGPHIPKYIPTECAGDDENGDATKEEIGSASCSTNCDQTNPVAEEVKRQNEPSTSKAVKADDISCDVKENAANDETSIEYEHLHQMFITKNTVLCTEVQKNFKELKNACPATKHLTIPDDSLPNYITDIHEEAWPLFIAARDWLLLLDASLPGEPFFPRGKDGSLLGKIEGWGQDDTHLHFIPDEDDDYDEVEENAEQELAAVERTEHQNPKSNKGANNKREVTYQVFVNELWPKMKKEVKNVDFHPTLVWTEIRSFIKGSAEALKTKGGYLSCQEYEDLGRKRAPAFVGDRPTVFKLFEIYRSIIRSSRKMFDEADLVHNLYTRLISHPEREWSIHYIYVDETQDFTQAELLLLIMCCHFPDRIFFTGDTAQSIMRGIAFRFKDLKSLFHSINTSTKQKQIIRVPDRLYQLTHNYRSHAGILRLASSVVNLLQNLFPESFDRLEKDCGLFEGPKPVLLESCSLTDLAMILRGSKRQGSRIEFGAHQAVLVVSEEARDNMPDELKHGLVLTIYEAKGLEFDDVLIYNFFKDSHARKEWRVVTNYIAKASSEEAHCDLTGLVEIPEEELKARPLEFNYEKHKVLNSELKFLYTAITRARVNVWFFDEDEENRTPVFEYFQRLSLVRSIKLDEQESTSTLSSMFAEGSTEDEWRDQGHYFYSKNLWDVAEKCFSFGEDEIMVRKCQAQKQAQQALQNRRHPSKMKDMFRTAAKQFLDCGMPKEAEVCLHNAREKVLLAHLLKKMNEFEEAAKLFRAEKCYDEASQCMEEINNYDQAVEIFCKANLYQKAIHVLERYNSLNVESPLVNQGIIPPKPNRTTERLCYKLAETYFRDGKRKEMEDTLQCLPTGNRITFLKKHNCVEEAARALVDDDKKDDAARYLRLHGRFKEAMKYSDDSKFLADCCLAEARSLRDKGEADVIEKWLEDAIIHYKRCKDLSGEGEAMLLLGVLRNDINTIIEAGKRFDSDHNVCGEIEEMEELLKRDVKKVNLKLIVKAIEKNLELLLNLHKPYTQLKADKQRVISKCEEYFGLSKIPEQSLRQYRTKTNERFHEIMQKRSDRQVILREDETVEVKQAYEYIANHLFKRVSAVVHKTTEQLKSKLDHLTQHSSAEISKLKERFEVVFNWAYLDGVTLRFQNNVKPFGYEIIPQETLELLTTKESKDFTSCQHLIQMLFPPAGNHPTFLSEQLKKIRGHSAVNVILNSYADHLCKTLDSIGLKNLDDTCFTTDTFLDISRVRQITVRTKRTLEFLQQKENTFKAREPESRTWKIMQKNGMTWESREQSYECFLRFWESGKRHLVNGNVIQSLHDTCRRFLSFTAKCRFLKFPSIENTVMILENQLTVALVMFARLNSHQRGTFAYLPISYLQRLRYSDELNCPRREHKWTYLAVDTYYRSLSNHREVNKCRTQVFSILAYIVKLMFGDFTPNFNVFVDTFCTNVPTGQIIASGVAERVMVLTLTMLANCGKAISVDCQAIILQNVFSVVPPEALPQHMKEAFKKLNDATGMGDVVSILQALLNESKENLCEVRWKGSTAAMDTRNTDPANNTLMFVVPVPDIKERITQPYGVETQRVVPVNHDDLEIEEEVVGEITEEVPETVAVIDVEKEERDQKENKAAMVIQRFFRNIIRNKKKALEKEELPTEVDRLSSIFKLDSSGCTICGVTFNETSEEMTSCLEDHKMSELHKQIAQEFENYKVYYNEEVQQVFDRKKSLHEQVDRSLHLDLEFDLQGLDEMEQKAWDIAQEIERDRKWQNLKGLKSYVQKLETKIQETQELVNKAQVDENNASDEEYLSFDDDDNEPPKLLPVMEKRKGKGGKGKGSRKKKK